MIVNLIWHCFRMQRCVFIVQAIVERAIAFGATIVCDAFIVDYFLTFNFVRSLGLAHQRVICGLLHPLKISIKS